MSVTESLTTFGRQLSVGGGGVRRGGNGKGRGGGLGGGNNPGQGGGSGPGPNIPTPLALLLMNGTNGSTTFTDETGNTTWTATDATISTTQSKFGGASGRFPNTTTNRVSGTNAIFAVGTGDFTASGWFRTDSGNVQGLLYMGPATYDAVYINSGRVSMYLSGAYRGQSPIVWNTGIWYNFTACRKAGVLKCYINGQGQDSYSTSHNFSGTTLRWGTDGSTSFAFQGYLDACSFYNVALYDGDFTPPTTEPSL